MQTQNSHKETTLRRLLWHTAGRVFGGITVLIGILYANNSDIENFTAPTWHDTYSNVNIAAPLYYAADVGAEYLEDDEPFPCPPCD